MAGHTFHLVFTRGPFTGRRVRLDPGAAVQIGRGAQAELRLEDPMLSRLHTAAYVRPNGVFVEDLGSKNGTYLNEQRVEKSRPLREGDQLVLGGSQLELQVVPEYEPAAVLPITLKAAPAASEQSHFETATAPLGDLLPPKGLDETRPMDARELWRLMIGAADEQSWEEKSGPRYAIPGYKMLKRLGTGSYGTVYAAQPDEKRRKRLCIEDELVALKLLPRDRVPPEELARLKQEGLTAAALDHPNVMRTYDLGRTDKYYYIVMEYIGGLDLLEVLHRRKRPLPWMKTVPIAFKVIDALEYAHDRSIVHRDLKPENIIVHNNGAVKVIDFGMAKVANNAPGVRLTLQGESFGTISYMPPEQVTSTRDVDARADLYSWGASFYHVLSNELPFQPDLTQGTLHAIMKVMPPSLHRLVPGIPGPLVEVIEACLAKDPEARPASAARLRESLRKAVARLC